MRIQNHAKIILSQNVHEYAPLFAEIGDAYFDNEMYAEAGQIYEILGADTEVIMAAPRLHIPPAHVISHYFRRAVFTSSCKQQHVDVWSEISKSRQKYTSTVSSPFLFDWMGQLLIDEIVVIAADSTHNEAKMKLAEIYEILGEPRKALDLVMQGKDPTPLFFSRKPQL